MPVLNPHIQVNIPWYGQFAIPGFNNVNLVDFIHETNHYIHV